MVRTAQEIVESTKDFILKELSKNLKGYDLEEFVEDLLKAMGYRTQCSPHGGDRGIDITAYKDELPPRIIVQVKSQDGDIRETNDSVTKGSDARGRLRLVRYTFRLYQKRKSILREYPNHPWYQWRRVG